MFKNIIWDFDGTLFNTYPMIVESFQKGLLDMGFEIDYNEIMKQATVSEAHALEYFQNKFKLDKVVLKEKYDSYRKLVHVSRVEPFENAFSLCADIKKEGKSSFIYTNRGKSIMDYLDFSEMTGLFKDIITREHKFPRKPAPDAVLHLIQKHGLNPTETIMIGDREIDIMSAKNAGIKGIYFDYHKEEKVTCADFSACDMKSIYEILGLKLVR